MKFLDLWPAAGIAAIAINPLTAIAIVPLAAYIIKGESEIKHLEKLERMTDKERWAHKQRTGE